VDLIRERFGFYHVSVFLLDETGTWAELAASTGEPGRMLLARRHRLAVGSNSIIGWVTARRAPRVALDVTQDPFHFRNPLLPETQSEAAVPLLVGDLLLGALDVQSKSPNAFAEDDVRALEAIGGELAVAIDRANLTQQMREELDRIAGMYRGRERESWARVAGRTGGREMRVGQPAGTEGQAGESFPSLDRAAQLASTAVDKDGREVAVPIQVRGQVIGSIAARRPGYGDRWDDEDIGVIEAVAHQAGVALEIARQYTEEQRRLTELEMINRISQGVSQRIRMDSLFRVVHSQFNQLLGNIGMVIAVFDSGPRMVRYLYAMSHGQPLHLPDEPLGEDQVSYLIRSQQPLLLNEKAQLQAAGIGIQLHEPVFLSWVGAPMMVGETVLGAMVLFDAEAENRFSDEDVGLLTTVASQMASALQNAQLLEEVQRASRRDRLIREITSNVRRASDVRTILETTAREVGRALNASRSTVRVAPEKLEAEAGKGAGGVNPAASRNQPPTGGTQP
jgi:GAF domain-containing protein